MKLSIILFASLIFTIAMPAEAQVRAKRHISLELEEVEGATQYEIELTSKNSSKVSNFKMKKALWTANITPGEYKLRLRSYDSRGVPGAWSEETSFLVKLPGPDLIKPELKSEIKTAEESDYNIDMSWADVPGTKKYKVDVTSEDGTIVKSEQFSEPRGSIKLPVAQKYKWTVTPISKSGEVGDVQETPGEFTLLGAPIETIEIEKPEDIWVQNIKWKKPDYVEQYTYMLQRKTDDGKWQKLEAQENFKAEEIPLSEKYPGGKFRIAVKGTAHLREPSKISTLEFDVYAGDRSPAAIEDSKLRYSLEKPSAWYFVASYLLTKINYSASNPYAGNNATVTYDAWGGTGRLGLGYIHPKRNDGFLGIIDLSGATVQNKNITYASSELHYVRRYTWGRNMVRPSAGLFYKEMYESRSSSFAPNQFAQNKIIFAGPHIGFDFWRPFTSKYGMQINTRIYHGLIGLSAPGGNDQQAELSYQVGFMGSYKIKPNITGFMGWAHRQDKATYESTPNSADPLSQASPGDKQSVTIQGNYINFLLEWGF